MTWDNDAEILHVHDFWVGHTEMGWNTDYLLEVFYRAKKGPLLWINNAATINFKPVNDVKIYLKYYL